MLSMSMRQGQCTLPAWGQSPTGDRTQGEGRLGRRSSSPDRVVVRMRGGQARMRAGLDVCGSGRALVRDSGQTQE